MLFQIAMEVSQGTISKYRFTIIDFIKEAMKPTTEVERQIEKKVFYCGILTLSLKKYAARLYCV